jgi:hypothetical protein
MDFRISQSLAGIDSSLCDNDENKRKFRRFRDSNALVTKILRLKLHRSAKNASVDQC